MEPSRGSAPIIRRAKSKRHPLRVEPGRGRPKVLLRNLHSPQDRAAAKLCLGVVLAIEEWRGCTLVFSMGVNTYRSYARAFSRRYSGG